MPAFLALIFGLALLLVGTALFVAGYLLWASSEKDSYREPRTILCPESLDYARVTVDAAHAVRTARAGHQEIRLIGCSRWPEMQGCDQACAVQVPLVGDDRAKGEYVAFGMTPDQLRSESPVRMTPDLFGKVMRQEVNRYLENKSA